MKQFLVTIVLLALLASSMFAVIAQDDPIPLPTAVGGEGNDGQIRGTPDPDDPRVQSMLDFRSELATRTLADYRVVYVTDEAAIGSNPYLTPEALAESQIHFATNWDDVLALNDEAAIQGLIIHQSALDFVDYEWVQQAYRDAVPVVGVNLFFPEMSELTGDLCQKAKGFENGNPIEGDFFIQYRYHVRNVENEADLDNIYHAELELCKDADVVYEVSTYSSGGGYGINPLQSDHGFSMLQGYLTYAMFYVEYETIN